jgi:serine protease Do
MNPAFRRFLALLVVFVAAFAGVTALRNWRAGGNLRSLLSKFSQPSSDSKTGRFTLQEKPPLDLSEVELLSRLNDEYAKLTEAVVPSVVSIDTAGIRSEQLVDWFGQARVRNYPTQGQGSGVIVTSEGHVMTNHHVIAGQQQIRVTVHNGKTYTAHLIGEDTLLDIAVLKIDSKETFQPLKLGDSSLVKVGQIVMAVGNPFGLGETVTQGIISAKERSLSDNQRDLFQTDAAINPGNSGGPLVNLRGEIIGINAAIFSQDKEKPSFAGVGFSIPSNDVKESLLQILERGRPIRGFLGVQMRELDPGVRTMLGYDGTDGAAIFTVTKGSPAEAAGLKTGDVVRAVDGQAIHNSTQLLALLQRSKVGTTLSLDIWRKGESLTLKATTGESGSTVPPAAQSPEEALKALGIEVRDLTEQDHLGRYRGVVVTTVTRTSVAAGKLSPGDVILAINNSPISNVSEFSLYLAASANQDIGLHLIRGGKIYQVLLPAVPTQQ